MRLELTESRAGELADLTPAEVTQRAQEGLCKALEALGHADAAAALRGRLPALLDAKRELTRCAQLAKALPARGGELDAVAHVAGRVAGAYDAMQARLLARLDEAVRSA